MSGPYIYIYICVCIFRYLVSSKTQGMFFVNRYPGFFLFKRAHRFELTVESTGNMNISHGMGGGGGGACGPCDPPV